MFTNCIFLAALVHVVSTSIPQCHFLPNNRLKCVHYIRYHGDNLRCLPNSVVSLNVTGVTKVIAGDLWINVKDDRLMVITTTFHFISLIKIKNNKNTTLSEQFKNPLAKSIPLTTSIDRSLSWLGTAISIKSGEVKLFVCAQSSPLSKMMQCFLHFIIISYSNAIIM